VGTELLEIKKDDADKVSAQRVWKRLKFRVKMSSFIHRDGYLYGLDDGILACIDARDGSPKWKEGRYGHGQILFIDDLLLVTAENGEIVLLAPTPEAPNEPTRFRVFSGKNWNPPALSGDLLLMRTDQEVACRWPASLELGGAHPPGSRARRPAGTSIRQPDPATAGPSAIIS
jgi:outer membrane protein assembly factor BamB